jgi:signal transduction histidine kinase
LLARRSVVRKEDIVKPFQASTRNAPEILPPVDDRCETPNAPAVMAVAGILHDLGNLIQIASSAINILSRTPGIPAIDSEQIVHRARISLDHAGMIVRQNIDRIRNRKTAGPRSDIVACLSDVTALVEAMDEPGLAVEIAVEPGLPDAVCDPTGLYRVMLNLVLNARDAMAGVGTVRITARGTPSEIELCIADRGTGMTPATIARVFDPFFTTKHDRLGGIGLPMVESFVRSIGGAISIESEPGLGTTVVLRLPAVAWSESVAAEANPQSSTMRSAPAAVPPE